MLNQKIILLIGVSLFSLLASCQTNVPDTTISNQQKKNKNWRTLTPEEEKLSSTKERNTPTRVIITITMKQERMCANAVPLRYMNQLLNLTPVVVGQALMISSKKT
jgi:hypothetical protein